MARRRRHGSVKHPSRKDLRGRKKYPASKVVGAAPSVVNTSLNLSATIRRYYNQQSTVQCVTHSTDELLSHHYGKLFHTGWGFYRAQERDGTPGESGTTTDAMLRVVRDLGNVVVEGQATAPLSDNPSATISQLGTIDSFHWLSKDPATALDEVRASLSNGMGVLFASPWYQTFDDDPTRFDPDSDWGTSDSMWHQYLIDGAFDNGSYLTVPNSWGWETSHNLSYYGFNRLVIEGGYGAIVMIDSAPVPPPPPSPDTFPCPRCGKEFTSKARMRRHVKRRH